MLIKNTSPSHKDDNRAAPKTPFNVMVVASETNPDITEKMVESALTVLSESNARHTLYKVPRISEIPTILRYAIRSMELFPTQPRFEAYLLLGCHTPAHSSDNLLTSVPHVIQDMAIAYTIAVGDGIVASEPEEGFGDPAAKGAAAAEICLKMAELKRSFKLYPRKV